MNLQNTPMEQWPRHLQFDPDAVLVDLEAYLRALARFDLEAASEPRKRAEESGFPIFWHPHQGRYSKALAEAERRAEPSPDLTGLGVAS